MKNGIFVDLVESAEELTKTPKTLVCAACSASICSKASHQVLFKQAWQPLAQYLRTAFGLAAQPRKTKKTLTMTLTMIFLNQSQGVSHFNQNHKNPFILITTSSWDDVFAGFPLCASLQTKPAIPSSPLWGSIRMNEKPSPFGLKNLRSTHVYT